MKLAIALICFAALAVTANAKSVDARKMTCEEFIGLDEMVKPQLIMFIQGATKTGKPEATLVEVDEVSKPVGFIAAECQKTPKATVWQKVENYVKKATHKL